MPFSDVPNQLELSDLGLVTEGDPTQVSCSVLHTCPLSPPILTWNLDENKAVTIQEYLTGGSWRTESSFNYIPSHKDHGRYLQCTATFPNKQQIYNGISLNIQCKCPSSAGQMVPDLVSFILKYLYVCFPEAWKL